MMNFRGFEKNHRIEWKWKEIQRWHFHFSRGFSTSWQRLSAEKSLRVALARLNGKQFLKMFENQFSFYYNFILFNCFEFRLFASGEWNEKLVKWSISRALTRKIEFKWTFHSVEMERTLGMEKSGVESLSRDFSSFVRFTHVKSFWLYSFKFSIEV